MQHTTTPQLQSQTAPQNTRRAGLVPDDRLAVGTASVAGAVIG